IHESDCLFHGRKFFRDSATSRSRRLMRREDCPMAGLVVCALAASLVSTPWRRSSRTWFEFFAWGVMYLFTRLWHGCKRIGADPLPAAGPAIVFANHSNHADPAFLIASCRRPLCFLQAREYFDIFLLRR